MEAIELYNRSADGWRDRLEAIPASMWNAPTPCDDWTVRDLVNHVSYEQRWIPPLLAGSTIAEIGDRFEGDLLGSHPKAVALEVVQRARAAVPAAITPGTVVHSVSGDVPTDEYLRQHAADYLVHSWDLAAGAGLDRELDPELVEAVAEWFTPYEERYREMGLTAARPSEETRTRQGQLLSAFGRESAWSAKGKHGLAG
jgi:uncharacterized protein (TIGR03086 family)